MTPKLTLGTRMTRTKDGVAGLVETVAGEPRVTYLLYGDKIVAPRAEAWEPADPPQWPLRQEEIKDVAMAADAMLRSLVMHQPNRFWEAPSDTAFDPGLVQVIAEYLGDGKK